MSRRRYLLFNPTHPFQLAAQAHDLIRRKGSQSRILDPNGKADCRIDRLEVCIGTKLSLDYRLGWQAEGDYQDYLHQYLQKDKEKGSTQGGPHRADIRIKLDDKPVQSAISRGQQKKLVAMLKLAQMDVFSRHSDKTCVLLYDDLPAELDADNRYKLLQSLARLPLQVFISAIEAEQLDLSGWQDLKMFHVEHGKVAVRS